MAQKISTSEPSQGPRPCARCDQIGGCVSPRPRTNFGDRPKGWQRLAFDLPAQLAKEVAEARDALPGASSKLVGTAALALFVGLPAEAREALYRWVHSHELDPEGLDTTESLARLVPLLMTLGQLVPPAGPGGGAAKGAPAGRSSLRPGEFEVRYPAQVRDGYTEERIVTYRVKDSIEKTEPDKLKTAAGA